MVNQAELDLTEVSTEPFLKATGLSATDLSNRNTQLLARTQLISHDAKAGLNPLVDTAAYLFSVVGKLRTLKYYRNLAALQKELINEINTFQDTVKTHGYSSEYILVSRYALCATLDDIITNTPWGTQGQWDNYSLLKTFNQEAGQPDRFFLILDRIMKDPSLYIDLMEFMYICLSLGFKGNYRATEFSNTQLELICNTLYKRIRAHNGSISKTLSPFALKSASAPIMESKKTSATFLMLTTASIILAIFIGLGYLLDVIANETYQELIQIGKSIIHETHNS